MAVLNTTSPVVSVRAPKDSPRNTRPSSSARSAGGRRVMRRVLPWRPWSWDRAPKNTSVDAGRGAFSELASLALRIDVGGGARQPGGEHAAGDGAARERGVAALRVETRRLDHPLGRRIEQHQIGRRAGLESDAWQPEHTAGRVRPQLERALEGQMTGMDETGDRERQRGLETHDPERR